MLGVLIVDDEYFIRKMFRQAINWQACGFVIAGEAGDGRQCIEIALRVIPDLILLDINLPDMDGFTAAAEIRKALPDVEIIIATGYDSFSFAKKAITFGIYEYLLKPVSDAELMHTVNSVRDKIISRRRDSSIVSHLTDDIFSMLPLLPASDMESVAQSSGKEAGDKNNHYLVRCARQYVDDHLSDPELSVESVSDKLFVNMSYLSHTFKKLTGCGLHEYINAQRMKKACDIIMRSEVTIGDLAKAVGYRDPEYFGRCLKKYFGVPFTRLRGIKRKYQQ